MRVSKVYEVWVGGDLLDDQMDYNTAMLLAKDEFKKEQAKPDPVDVVIDEHSYIEIEAWEDFEKIGE